MSSATLLAAAVVDLAGAAMLASVGVAFRRGHAAGGARRALLAFQAWWFGIAFTVFTNGAKELAVAAGVHEAAWAVAALDALQYAYIAATCAAVAGLLYYLVYLFTGDARWFWPLAGFYALYAAVALAFLARLRPDGVVEGKWFVQWDYAAPTAGGPVFVILVLLLLLPQLIAAIVYLNLSRQTSDAATLRRIRVVGWSLIAWLGLTLLAPFVQLGRFEAWQAGGRLVALVAGFVIWRAYAAALPHRAVEEEADERRVAASVAREDLRRRVSELV